MSKFARQQYLGPQLKDYLNKKYKTYDKIVETASKNTSLIKQIYISFVIGITTMFFGGILSTACIAYVKYNKDFTDYISEFGNIFAYVIYSVIGMFVVFSVVCIFLNAIWYKRQSNYRKLKQKSLFEITIATNDQSKVTQSIEEYEDEFNLLEYDVKNNCDCKMFKSVLKESLVFIIPAVIVIALLLCLFLFL